MPKDGADAEVHAHALVGADVESSFLCPPAPPALVRTLGDNAASSSVVAPAGPQVSVEAVGQSTDAHQDGLRD